MSINNPDVFLWTESALAAAPCDAAVVAFMRHGEKEAMSGAEPAEHLPRGYDCERMLTARGEADAKIMGRLLMDDIVRIEHSDVPRCRQTAESMACGAKFDGVIRENWALAGAPLVNFRKAWKKGKESVGGYSKLIDRLATDGCYPGFNPVHPVMANMADNLLSSAKSGVNVSVSHDGVLYLMLSTVGAKVTSFSKERISYLETLFLWREGNRIIFRYRDQQRECDDCFHNFLKEGRR